MLLCTKSSQLASLTPHIIFTPPSSPLTRNTKGKREEMHGGNTWPYLTSFVHLAHVASFREQTIWVVGSDWELFRLTVLVIFEKFLFVIGFSICVKKNFKVSFQFPCRGGREEADEN